MIEKYSKQFKIIQNSLEIQIQNEQYNLAQDAPEPANNYSEKFYSLQLDLGSYTSNNPIAKEK